MASLYLVIHGSLKAARDLRPWHSEFQADICANKLKYIRESGKKGSSATHYLLGTHRNAQGCSCGGAGWNGVYPLPDSKEHDPLWIDEALCNDEAAPASLLCEGALSLSLWDESGGTGQVFQGPNARMTSGGRE
eukprot:1142916-Pelagomonas_calceolata.AAC.5